MPVYLPLSFFEHVNRKSDLTVSISLKNFCHNLVKNYHGFEALKCFITYVYFVLITDSQVHTVSVILSNESYNA